MNSVAQNMVSMTSREIAEVCEKEHRHVIRDIRKMLTELQKDGPVLGYGEIKDGRGYTDVFHLDKELTETLITGYSIRLRRKVIIRLHQLEEIVAASLAPALPNFDDPVASARAWADATEQKQIAQQALAIAAPKAEFVDRYVEATGLQGFRQVAKLLGIKENLFRAFLVEHKIQYQIGGEWVPYANHIDAGRFEVKTGTAEHNDHAFTSAKFTPRGIEYVARLLRDSKKIEPEKALSLEVSA
jgi:phage antirepressor YoqD-like protein